MRGALTSVLLGGAALGLTVGVACTSTSAHDPGRHATMANALEAAPSHVYSVGVFPDACLDGSTQPAELAWAPEEGPRYGAAVVRRCHLKGPAPDQRAAHLVFYDQQEHALYMFGGDTSTTAPFSDTWRLAVSEDVAWELAVPGETAAIPWRYHAAGVFDPVGRRLVVYGGRDDDFYYDEHTEQWLSPVRNDVWVLYVDSLDEGWIQLDLQMPQRRYSAKALYDPVGHAMIVYGGRDWDGAPVGDETLRLSLAAGEEGWTTIEPSKKPPGEQERVTHGFIYDSERRRAILIGGVSYWGGKALYGDVWALPLDDPGSGWIELTQTNPGPAPGFFSICAFYEPKADRYYVGCASLLHTSEQYGVDIPKHSRDFWALIPGGDDTVTWRRLRTSMPAPQVRVDMVWDTELEFGISAYGRADTNLLGSDVYYNEEVRLYAVLDPDTSE